ncbi:MAG: type IV pilin protein [Candidatus Omnitrophota bacterium]
MILSAKKKAFTLVEITIVLVILGILAGIAWPNFMRSKERALAKEAIVGLKLIRAAEMVYQSENGTYYPSSGSQGNIATINTNLRLTLSETNWDYTITGGASAFTATANRQGSGPYKDCVYTITQATAEPTANSCP